MITHDAGSQARQFCFCIKKMPDYVSDSLNNPALPIFIPYFENAYTDVLYYFIVMPYFF